MIWRQPHLPMLGQSRDEKSSLHPGKALADAAARSAAKRKIGKLRSSFARTSRPTIRIKSQRLRKIARVAVRHELAHQHQRFFGHKVAANLRLTHRKPAYSPRRLAM